MKRWTACMAILISTLVAGATWSQSPVLLEACNSIADADKRLLCLKELVAQSGEQSKSRNAATGVASLKRVFTSISASTSSGMSYKDYSGMAQEPVRAVAIFRSENPGVNADALQQLSDAAEAYKDAEILWRAHVYRSQDAGFGSRILNYKMLRLDWIVDKYHLPTKRVLLNDHVSIEEALPRIWRYAESNAKDAFQALEPER